MPNFSTLNNVAIRSIHGHAFLSGLKDLHRIEDENINPIDWDQEYLD